MSTKLFSLNSSSSLKGKRVLICEEGLIDYNAHFYSWVKSIRQINQDAGVEVIVAGNKEINPNIQEELDVQPTFSRNNWSDIYNSRGRVGRAVGLLEHNWITYREVDNLLKTIGPVDCIILPAVRAYHLIAWKQLCKKYMGSNCNRLAIFLLNSHAVYNEDYTDYTFPRSSKLMSHLVQSFRTYVEADQVVLCGDSHITCGEFERMTGLPFRVFPSPGAALNQNESVTVPEPEQETNSNDGPTFVMLGVSFYDKGIDLLQTAIIQHFKKYPDSNSRFVVQWSKETIDYDGNKVEIQSELRNHPRVELLETTLSDEDYRARFEAADFIVLPYRRSVYFNRLSGVAVEAACSGIPMIVTENTWLAWAVTEFGCGVTIKNNDAADLMEKIRYCCNHKTELQRLAVERQSIALEYNSSENYLRCQWEQ